MALFDIFENSDNVFIQNADMLILFLNFSHFFILINSSSSNS